MPLSRPYVIGAAFTLGKWKEYESMKLTKYEKETIILTSEGDDTEDKKIGCQSYVVDKARLSIRLTAPYSEERRKAARERALKQGF